MLSPQQPILPALLAHSGIAEAMRASAVGGHGITYVESARTQERVSYVELLARAAAMLGHLQSLGMRPGDVLVLVTDDLPLFTAVFWACASGGLVVVPIAVPSNDAGHLKLSRVLAAMGQAWLAADVLEAVTERVDLDLLPQARRLRLDRSMFVGPPGKEHPAHLDQVVLIQFSSGSTGQPKGVQVTSRNLLANASGIVDRVRIDSRTDRMLSWMPLTHDMGIVYFHVVPAVCGVEQALISTPTFMRHPLLWMQKASEFQTTITGGPNYAYHHFLKRYKPDAETGWRLDALRIIANGAEPISCDLSRRFFGALERHGLSAHAAKPGYGLAEATLMVSHTEPEELFRSCVVDRRRLSVGNEVRFVPSSDPDALEFATAGPPALNVELRITDLHRQPLPEGHVGNVETRSACVTPGYYGRDVDTRAVIDDEGWLDTGDLGFLSEGELYITGRRKDLVIINGVNFYPHDIEDVAAQVPPLDLNTVVACSVRLAQQDREGLALFVRNREEGEAFMDLADRLRDHVVQCMGVPVDHVLAIRQIPKTTSGKVQRFLLAQRFADGEFDEQMEHTRARRVGSQLRLAWNRGDAPALTTALLQEAARIAPKTDWSDPQAVRIPLMELGLDSMRLVEFMARINESLGQQFPVSWMFDHPTVSDLVGALLSLHDPRGQGGSAASASTAVRASVGAAAASPAPSRDVAVIGVACRFPGDVDHPDAFWTMLRDGVDATGPFPADRWDPLLNAEARTDRGAYLRGLDRFDHRFFRLTPLEAERLDPQQRLLLTVSWEAFEHAGIDPLSLRGSLTGVFTAIGASDYAQAEARSGRLAEIGPYAFTGTAASVASGRLSFFHGLEGPNVTVDTACSAALSAVHLAVQALRNGECNLALASAVNLILGPDMQVGLSRLNALAPDGRCKTFDASADGYARGEGCAGVVLKRLDDAIRDGDPVLAVIRGSAMNHDGASNGLTAPNGAAQQKVIMAALRDAGIEPGNVDYVEAHGTGTALGDPVEVMALSRTYGQGRPPTQPLLIGSVKTNVAHLETAAGMASLLKVVLALQHRQLPASLHLRKPNPMIAWDSLPVRVVDSLMDWSSPVGGVGRSAGISAFGMSGTNVHLIVSEAPAACAVPVASASQYRHARPSQGRAPVLLLLSARNADDLAAMAARQGRFLEAHPERLDDLAHTLACNRSRWPVRWSAVGDDAGALASELAEVRVDGRELPRASRWVCVFPGQGSQFPGALRDLVDQEPVFRSRLEQADAILQPVMRRSLLALLLDGSPDDLARTEFTQPATVACGLALFELWRSWGLRPDAVVGHSVGEIAAAAAAGAIDWQSALIFSARRGALMQRLPAGAMLAAACSQGRVEELLGAGAHGVEIAAINGRSSISLAGTVDAIEDVATELTRHGVRTSRLRVSHAFHSAMMDPILEELGQLARELLQPADSHTALVSAVTGDRIELTTQPADEFWRRHARDPVRFSDALDAAGSADTVFLELGARPVFSVLAVSERPDADWLVCSDARGRMLPSTLRSLGRAFERGFDLDARALFASRSGRFIRIPAYPFQGKTPMLSIVKPAIPDGAGSGHPPVVAAAVERAPAPADPGRPASGTRTAEVSDRLRRLVSNVSGLAQADVVPDANWFALGLDSLLVLQLQLALNKAFGLDVKLSDIFERGTTLRDLTTLVIDHLDALPAVASRAPVERPLADPGVAVSPVQPDSATGGAPAPRRALDGVADTGGAPVLGRDLEHLMLRQIESLERLFQQQLEVLQPDARPARALHSSPTGLQAPTTLPAPAAAQAAKPAMAPAAQPLPASPTAEASAPAPKPSKAPVEAEVKGLFRQAPQPKAQWNGERRAHVQSLAAAYVDRTAGSRRLTADGRSVYANPRAVIGFRPEWKEMTFPLHVERAEGAHVWDVDGNRYVDITMGFGATLLGHNPSFVRQALVDEIARGAPLGPQTPHALEVARLIREMTGAERVAFFTTGSEAVMVAVRLARAVTKRNRIVIFTNAYHGTFDGFLAMGWVDEGKPHTYPLTDGTPPKMVEDVVVLRYGDPRALQTVRELGADLAAVLVEPVQSRDPTIQPREFLHELRRITEDFGAALIFDEMIFGFRVHPAGAQHHFGVRADLCTYGKVVGGGMPIGVVAGRARFMDAVDGGHWQYGDDSAPRTRTAFVAGTFNNHPLSMVAAKAVLGHLQAAGPELQAALNARTAAMAGRLNRIFETEQVPIRCLHFSSLFRFDFAEDCEVLNYHLLRQGVFVWEGRNCFLSTAHTDADVDFIVEAVQIGVREMRAARYVPPRAASPVDAPMAAVAGR